MNCNKKYALSFLFLMTSVLFGTFVSAQVDLSSPSAMASSLPGAIGSGLSWLYDKLVPDFSTLVGGPWTVFTIGIIVAIIIFVIFVDLAMLISPFSNAASKIIGVGLGFIAILLGVVRNVSFAILSLGALIFGTAGTLAVVASLVMSILFMIAFFTGGNWMMKHLKKMRVNKEGMDTEIKAMQKGNKIRALGSMAEEATR